MTSLSQSPIDHLLWILVNNDGKMERCKLRAAMAMRYAYLNPILERLVEEGKIEITDDDIILL